MIPLPALGLLRRAAAETVRTELSAAAATACGHAPTELRLEPNSCIPASPTIRPHTPFLRNIVAPGAREHVVTLRNPR